jgi:class 3 adenylate cyclase
MRRNTVLGEGALEVTALEDEANERARIERSATHGQVLASKAVVERLAAEDAHDLGLALRSRSPRAR